MSDVAGTLSDAVGALFFCFVVGSTIWVYVDAKKIGVKKDQIKGLGNLGAVGWFWSCFFLWYIAFPLYLIKRPELKAINMKQAGR